LLDQQTRRSANARSGAGHLWTVSNAFQNFQESPWNTSPSDGSVQRPPITQPFCEIDAKKEGLGDRTRAKTGLTSLHCLPVTERVSRLGAAV